MTRRTSGGGAARGPWAPIRPLLTTHQRHLAVAGVQPVTRAYLGGIDVTVNDIVSLDGVVTSRRGREVPRESLDVSSACEMATPRVLGNARLGTVRMGVKHRRRAVESDSSLAGKPRAPFAASRRLAILSFAAVEAQREDMLDLAKHFPKHPSRSASSKEVGRYLSTRGHARWSAAIGVQMGDCGVHAPIQPRSREPPKGEIKSRHEGRQTRPSNRGRDSVEAGRGGICIAWPPPPPLVLSFHPLCFPPPSTIELPRRERLRMTS